MSLPYFETFGWEASILTVKPDTVEAPYDPLLLKTIPHHISVTQTPALPTDLTKRIGLGTLGWRCLPYFLQAGNQLLKQIPFDLVYFSTTAFVTMGLAERWKKQFGIPYILDFQDPWLSDYYKQATTKPPGGWLKYGFSQTVAKRLEPKAMKQVSQVISVSPAYPEILKQRYNWLRDAQFTVLPFGAPESDFELLPTLQVKQHIFDPQDGKRHWVYVGRGGNDMALALRSLFLGIREARDRNPNFWQSIHLHFVGTSYAPPDRAVKTIEPIAQEFGIGNLVTEHTQRIPYFEAIQTLVDSDAILMIGSDDPTYTASKLYPCVLARKPILAIFHENSSVISILESTQAGQAVTFNHQSTPADLQPKMARSLDWLTHLPQGFQPDTNWATFEPYTAKSMTRQQCAVFDRCFPS
jgi:Glycosyl transferase 4-like domain